MCLACGTDLAVCVGDERARAKVVSGAFIRGCLKLMLGHTAAHAAAPGNAKIERKNTEPDIMGEHSRLRNVARRGPHMARVAVPGELGLDWCLRQVAPR